MLNILVADDHALVREGVREILSASDIDCRVSDACNGAEALEMGLAQPWDLIILDITMPLENGMSVLQKLISQKPNLRIVMLSMHANPIYVKHALKLGAVGYLIKESAPFELVAAISEVFRGGIYLSQALPELPDTGDLPSLPNFDPEP